MILVPCEQGSSEWQQARAGACTASRFSDARSRMKVNRGGKRVGDLTDVCEQYAQLLAIERIAGEPLDQTFQTWQMRRGTELEPDARALYEQRTGAVVLESGVVLTDDRRIGYSTDGEVYGQPGGVEIKCPAAGEKVAGIWLHPDEVIAEYLDQIDGGIWLRHWQWIDLVVYTPWLASVGKDLFIRRITRSEDRIGALQRDLVEFLRVVNGIEASLRGVAPPSLAEVPPWEGEVAMPEVTERKPPRRAEPATPAAPITAPSF